MLCWAIESNNLKTFGTSLDRFRTTLKRVIFFSIKVKNYYRHVVYHVLQFPFLFLVGVSQWRPMPLSSFGIPLLQLPFFRHRFVLFPHVGESVPKT
jgi:hypothetical protein